MTYSPQRRAETRETEYAEHAAAPVDRGDVSRWLYATENDVDLVALFPTSSRHGLNADDHSDVEVNP